MANESGKIVQVMGPVVDVEFPQGALPELFTALRTTNPGVDEREMNLVVEVALHLGENTVRCIAMDTSDGLIRGQEVQNTGAPITVPVGPTTLGRIMNVIGEPIGNEEDSTLVLDEIFRRPPRQDQDHVAEHGAVGGDVGDEATHVLFETGHDRRSELQAGVPCRDPQGLDRRGLLPLHCGPRFLLDARSF